VPDKLLQDLLTAYEPMRPPALPEEPFTALQARYPGRASAADEFGLLRLRDLARADLERALVVSTRADSFRFIGYVNFTALALKGAGSAGPQLFTLARYMSEYTSIKARVRQRPPHYTFLSDELLEDPLHFLFQALHPPQRGPFTQFDRAEIARLGEYLRHGGTLYVEGSPPFLTEIYDHVRRALGDSTTVAPLPLSHPLYRAYYRFDDGFPGERPKRPATAQEFFPASSTPYPSPFGLWGVEVDGEVAVLFNDLPLIGGLYLPSTYFQELVPLARGALAAATNIVTYALTRPQGMAAHREPPLWTRISADR
jgi:hypothetical protein